MEDLSSEIILTGVYEERLVGCLERGRVNDF
jgi:hypothetical protein